MMQQATCLPFRRMWRPKNMYTTFHLRSVRCLLKLRGTVAVPVFSVLFAQVRAVARGFVCAHISHFCVVFVAPIAWRPPKVQSPPLVSAREHHRQDSPALGWQVVQVIDNLFEDHLLGEAFLDVLPL